jgi:MFS family permease
MRPLHGASTGTNERAQQLRGLFALTICVGGPFNTMLPVLPLIVLDASGSAAATGVVSAALALGTMTFELATPRLILRWPAVRVLVWSFLISGAAVLGLALAESLVALVPLGAIYGLGFGIGATIVSMLPSAIDHARSGTSFGIYGLGSSLTSVVGPPAALLSIAMIDVRDLLLACGAVALAGVLCSPSVKSSLTGMKVADVHRRDGGSESWWVLAPYGCMAFAFGGIMSTAVFHLTGDGVSSAAAFLVMLGVFRAISRTLVAWLTGVAELRLLETCSVAVAALGLGVLVGATGPPVLAAAVLFGLGFGAMQTISLVAVTRTDDGSRAWGAAVWGFTTDAGMGLGALVFAPIATLSSYTVMFSVLPALAVGALAVSLYGGRRRDAAAAAA